MSATFEGEFVNGVTVFDANTVQRILPASEGESNGLFKSVANAGVMLLAPATNGVTIFVGGSSNRTREADGGFPLVPGASLVLPLAHVAKFFGWIEAVPDATHELRWIYI